jgi:uncharacterized protein (TIGR02001 family)
VAIASEPRVLLFEEDAQLLVVDALPLPDPGFELLLSSHGMSQGVSQTKRGQVIPRLYLRLGKVRVGGQWRNIDSPVANGIAALFVRYSHDLGRTQMDLTVAYRLRTGVRRDAQKTAWEFTTSARRSFGRFGLRATSDYSFDDFSSDHSLYVELGPTLSIGKTTIVSANVGRRERERGPDYTSFNIGLSKSLGGKLTLDARYYDTNLDKPAATFGARFVASARLSL